MSKKIIFPAPTATTASMMNNRVRSTDFRTIVLPLLLILFLFTESPSLSAKGEEEMTFSPFSTPLPIPEILDSREENGYKIFELEAMEGEKEFFPGTATPTLGYNGDYLGPTIRVRTGESVRIRVKNTLKETTTVHWHGAHIPADMDGGPHQQIIASETWEAVFQVKQEAATLWYHPHMVPTTARQVYQGLAGLLLIEDENSAALPIPKEYGKNDIPLVIQEREFFSDGTFSYGPSRPEIMHGYFGNVVLVNGAVQPYLTVEESTIRLRVLNGSNSSVLKLQLENQAPFLQIASDGGFLEYPVESSGIVLSPGERAELLLDFSGYGPGEKLNFNAATITGDSYSILQFRTPDEGWNDSLMKTGTASDHESPVRELTFPDTALRLNTIAPIPESEAERQRRFVMSTMGPAGFLTINGKTMNMERIDEYIPLGATEIWRIENTGGRGGMGMMNTPHSFHVHDVQFQILSVNGQPPPPHESGWKDTVLLWPGDIIRIIMRFEDFTGIYMYHCHLLEHEDAGMMGQFEVISR